MSSDLTRSQRDELSRLREEGKTGYFKNGRLYVDRFERSDNVPDASQQPPDNNTSAQEQGCQHGDYPSWSLHGQGYQCGGHWANRRRHRQRGGGSASRGLGQSGAQANSSTNKNTESVS